MTDERTEEAAQAAKRARGEAKAAARDTARAAKAGAEVAADAVAEEARDAAEKLEGTVRDAERAIMGLNIPAFLMDSSIGLGCLSLSMFFGAAGIQAFRHAAKDIKR